MTLEAPNSADPLETLFEQAHLFEQKKRDFEEGKISFMLYSVAWTEYRRFLSASLQQFIDPRHPQFDAAHRALHALEQLDKIGAIFQATPLPRLDLPVVPGIQEVKELIAPQEEREQRQ